MAYIQDVQESVPALPEAGNLTSFVVLSQNENGRKLLFKIVGIDIPSGSTATLSGTKPDGVVYSTTGTISGNIVTVNEDTQMTAVAGSWDAKIRVLNGGNVIASAKVRITIDADPVAPGSIPSDSQLDGIVAECQAYAESARSDAYGSPLTASTAAGMIDKTRVYVYTGSETGYTNGHWYYWDGTAWADGGTYNSSGIQTDTTLSVPGMAADAKAVGDELSDVKEEISDIKNETKPDIHFNWVHGGIDNATGQLNNNGSLTRSRDEAYYKVSDLFSITNGSTSILWIIFYTESGGTYTFASSTNVAAGSTYNFNSGEYVVRFDIRGSLSEAALVSGVRNSQIVEDVLHLKSSLTMVINDAGLAIYATKWGLSNNKWYKYDYNTAWIIPVRAGDVVTLKRSGISYYTVFKTITNQGNGNVPDYATGFSGIVSYSTPQAQVTIPSDGAYLWLYIYNGTVSTAPTVFTINGLDMLKSLRQNLEALVATDAINAENIETNTADIATLDTRMDLADSVLAESRKYASLKNELANGDFHTAGSPMIATGCALSVSDNILTATGDGTDILFDISEYLYITNLSLHHYYVGVWVKTNDDNCDAIALRIAGGLFESTIYKPVKNKWYYVALNQNTNNTGNTAVAYTIRAIYADATTQSGKSISIKQATMFYTNVDFGIGIDPALYKLMWITQHNAFWTGTQTVTIWEKESVNALTKQKNSFGQKRRPIVSFVDDDGYERAFAQFSPLSEKYNVPFTLAVSIDSTIKDWQGLYAQSELGWEIAAHPSDGNLADKLTEAEIESVMVDTNAYLDAHGYKWSNVVYANGEPDERVRRIAKKYYDCGVCGSNATINRGVIANFEIQRLPIGYPMGDTWNTLAHFKSLVDDAIANNGWCVFMTHAGMETGHPDSLTEIMDQLIDYIINDCKIEIMTLNDGFKVFGNALETGDFLGENARQGDDKTTGIAITKNGMLGNVIGVKSMDNLLTTLGQALGGTFATSCDPDTGEYTYTFTQT